jgi:cysteine desulfurase
MGALAFTNTRLHIIGGALVKGGGQEKGLRAGTENVAGIVGFGAAAAQVAGQGQMAGLVVLRDRLEADVARRMSDAVFFGQGVARLPQTSSFAVAGMTAETLLIALDLAGIAVSSGSACSSGKVQPSHVLLAMGVEPDLAKGALRVSLGAENTDRDIEAFCEALDKSVRNIRARSQMSAA